MWTAPCPLKTEEFSSTAERFPGNNPISNKGLEPKNCDFYDRVLAGVLRPRGRSISCVEP